MKTITIPRISALLPLAASLCITSLGHAAEEPAPPADPGWPREFTVETKKDSDGNWSSNTGGGWKPAADQPQPKPAAGTQPQARTTQPQARTTQAKPLETRQPTTQAQRPASRPQPSNSQSLDSMSRSRERRNTQTQRAQSFQGSTNTNKWKALTGFAWSFGPDESTTYMKSVMITPLLSQRTALRAVGLSPAAF